MSDYLKESYDRAIRDLCNAEARIALLSARCASLEEVADAAVIVCNLVDEKSSMVYGLLERPLSAAGYLKE